MTGNKVNNDRKSRPFTRISLEFNSPQMSKAFDTTLVAVDNSLYRLTRAPIISEEARSLVAGQLEEHFATAERVLETSRSRCNNLLEANGIEPNVEYTNSHVVEGILTCPHTRRYMKLAKESDEVISIIDTLWLSGALDDQQSGKAGYELTRNLFKLRGRLNALGQVVSAEKKAQSDPKKPQADKPRGKSEKAAIKENVRKAEAAQMQGAEEHAAKKSESVRTYEVGSEASNQEQDEEVAVNA